MKTKSILTMACVVAAAFIAGAALTDNSEPVIKTWYEINSEGKKIEFKTIDGIMVHERDPKKQPFPLVVKPGEPCCDKPMGAPSDAVVLFDGTEESFRNNWTSTDPEKPSKWKLVDGAMESVKKAGYIQSKQKFGSCQFHIEFATPSVVKGSDQGRGNSGVFLMGYEIQVLDSYKVDDDDKNQTYPDGQAGALYGRKKPDFNVCREPGQWQTYDIAFIRPTFDENGKVVRKAHFIVHHNGVLIHHDYDLTGGTGWRGAHSISEYVKHDDKLPIRMQDHGNPVRFRNVWVRDLSYLESKR